MINVVEIHRTAEGRESKKRRISICQGCLAFATVSYKL